MYLGTYPPELFVENEAKAAVEKFRNRLEEIEKEIKERNEDLDVPYTYLLPSRIPNSITI